MNDKILIQKKKINQLLCILAKYLDNTILDTKEVFLPRIIKNKINNIKYNDEKLYSKLTRIFKDYKNSIIEYEKLLKEKT